MWGPIIGAAIGAGSNLLGGLFGRSGAEDANAKQMAFNHQEAQYQREWQEHMASTQYARARTDMLNAGLNPILALGGPSPGGSGAAASIGTLHNPGAAMQEGVSNAGQLSEKAVAMNAGLAQADKDKTASGLNTANERVADATELFTKQQTIASAAQVRKVAAEIENIESSTRNNVINSSILSHGVNTAREEAELRRLSREAAERFGVGSRGQEFTTIQRGAEYIYNLFRGQGNSGPNAGRSSPSPSPSAPGRNPILPPAPSQEREEQGRRFRGN